MCRHLHRNVVERGQLGKVREGGIGGSDGLLLYNVNTPATDPTCQHVLAKGSRIEAVTVFREGQLSPISICEPILCSIT